MPFYKYIKKTQNWYYMALFRVYFLFYSYFHTKIEKKNF